MEDGGVTVTSNWSDEGKYDAEFYSKIASKYDSSYNSAETALEIGTAAQLAAFAKFVNDGKNFSGKFVCLTADISLRGTAPTVDYQNDGDSGFKVVLSGEISNNWVTIGMDSTHSFNGTFDGKNHSILDMVNSSDGNYEGLFGYVNGATIQNVGVKDSFLCCLLGSADKGSITAGMLVGVSNNSEIQNCYCVKSEIYVALFGSFYLGGICGEYGSIKNCYSNCNIFGFYSSTQYTSAGLRIGGILGDSNGRATITSCNFSGKIYCCDKHGGNNESLGGIVGNPYGGTSSNSYYDKDAAPDISAAGGQEDTEEVKGLSAAEFEQKFTEMTDETGNKLWFADPESGALDSRKTPKSSDFVFTLPDDLDYDGKGKVIKIVPKTGITGMGAVTVKYYKVENGSTTLLAGPPTDAGRYKVKFDVAAGTEYYAATGLLAMF